MKQPTTWTQAARDRFAVNFNRYHQRFLADLAVVAVLLFGMGCLWLTVGRWITLGALLMFLPKLITDGSRLLDLAIVRDRFGLEPQRPGRHSGKHPRPQARNKA